LNVSQFSYDRENKADIVAGGTRDCINLDKATVINQSTYCCTSDAIRHFARFPSSQTLGGVSRTVDIEVRKCKFDDVLIRDLFVGAFIRWQA